MEHRIRIGSCASTSETRPWFPREIIPMTQREYQQALQKHSLIASEPKQRAMEGVEL